MNVRAVTPTFKISVGLVMLSISIFLFAAFLGLVPDERKMALKARAVIAEAIAVQLSEFAGRNDPTGLDKVIGTLAKRNREILSVALRRANGKLLASSENHDAYWKNSNRKRSTPTHVQVQLNNGGSNWGRVEIAFKALKESSSIGGLPVNMLILILFLAAFSLAGYFLILKRALRELDPANVIPERVQSAFNTLSEGVIIMDPYGLVLLMNNSFVQIYDPDAGNIVCKRIDDLHWLRWSDDVNNHELPWQLAIRKRKSVVGFSIGLRIASGEVRSLVVNATCIKDGKDNVSGVIATFDDITEIEQKNDDLNRVVKKLRSSKKEISRQNRELQYLANHDPLSGCLNRRAFFEQFPLKMQYAHRNGLPFACMMVDLDFFKKINDNFGHSVGDEVIATIAEILKSNGGRDGLVCRYGGEEFCLALMGTSPDEALAVAERIRKQVIAKSDIWPQMKKPVTTSIGLANLGEKNYQAIDFVNMADQALYAAKEGGRNRVVIWEEMQAKASTAVREPESEPAETVALAGNQDAPADPRRAFIDKLTELIAGSQQHGRKLAVLQISIDSHEQYADLYGDAAGMDFIRGVSSRLSGVLRQSDTLSLLSDDQALATSSIIDTNKFAIAISDLEDIENVPGIINRLTGSLVSPIPVGGHLVYVSSSIGVSVCPDDGVDAESLLRNANLAEKDAKKKVRTNSYKFYSQEIDLEYQKQFRLEHAIRKAMEQNGFTIHYQPIIDAQSGQVTAAEALLRGTTTELRGVPIQDVICTAERAGLMPYIGNWIKRSVIRQVEDWLDQGVVLPRISINLSSTQLADSAEFEELVEIVSEMRLKPHMLQFEITETSELDNVESALKSLHKLQKLGIQFALDDFGTGYSSFSHLKLFQPDTIKIDRSFIKEITDSGQDAPTVSAIIAMSKAMKLNVVAEGVETATQLSALQKMGCDEIQGFFIAQPMSGKAMFEWLQMFSRNDGLIFPRHPAPAQFASTAERADLRRAS